MTTKIIREQNSDATVFFGVINQHLIDGWCIVPGTMYITSVEIDIPLPAGQKSRKLEVIGFVIMEKLHDKKES